MDFYNNQVKSWRKFLIFLAVFVGCMIIGSVIGAVITLAGGSMLLMQAVTSAVMFGGTALIYCLLFERKGFLGKTFFRGVDWKWLLVALAVFAVGFPLESAISVETEYNDLIFSLCKDTSVMGLVWLILEMGLLTAVIEEWIFRGILQRLFIQWTKHVWAGILIASALFSLIHLDMPNFFARFIMGVVIGLLYQYSGNIWTNIGYHFINNTFAAVGMWLYMRNGRQEIDDYEFSLPLIILSAVLLIAFIVYNELKNKRSIKSNYIEEFSEATETLTEQKNESLPIN